ncbi:uncharacterized protein P174DRAFT_446248 [Aspergillus novofumigatus IBT 16806]|uniref:Uncharacterized protein n=1 Tax=Aspergillus novofumigatus (strain IBT 16806) TaxID=1392255 RepID=A0A2I1BTT0_ASPN1|nr:uncharacterized protein P174DRAFT_446248 [Aspergillus novofumigatus IBT 16806]PKX88744.1 hypothetical protein P174DRAFT_446248 [Aspergillus novofumigatus IBT 16806]
MAEEQLNPDDEALDRPFRFIVTGKYLAVRYADDGFTLHRDYHGNGSLFYLSEDETHIIRDHTYVGRLNSHPIYKDNVFHICRHWTDNIDEALDVQIDPEDPDRTDSADSADSAPILSLSEPIMDPSHPVSADGIDLYHPDKQFALYPVTSDGLWYGDASNFNGKLIFGGNPYSAGIPFQLSVHEGRTQIRASDGMYLTVVMEDDLLPYLKEECRQHSRVSSCAHCSTWYSLGFRPEPDDCLALIPHGLPSMFVLHDGAFYYSMNVLKASYAETERVKHIEEASLFQFVG